MQLTPAQEHKLERLEHLYNEAEIQPYLEGTSPQVLVNINIQQLRDEIGEVMHAHPYIKTLHREVILNQNFEALKSKSQKQLKALQKQYFGMKSWIPSVRSKLIQKLNSFETFINNLKPIRGDANAANFEEFLSPSKTGTARSLATTDVMVGAQNYVYASLDGMAHYMAGNNAVELDENDIANRTQMVMIDVADIITRYGEDRTIERYLNNLFDYETGKKILAIYFALIFDTPKDAQIFIANSKGKTENWEDTPDYIINPESKKRMQEINLRFGIEPPLNLELRVLNSAKIKRA